MTFHAHPDDEVIQTGGVLSKAADAGEHVVVVTATDGAEGEIHNYDDPDAIKPILAQVRAEEMAASMAVLGVENQVFLGYRDSGMMGEESNTHPDAFWQADFMEAVGRLVRQIRLHTPEVLVIYDPYGGYGHPDHINVHRIGLAAYTGCIDLGRFPLEDGEELWEPAKLYWTTWPRSRVITMTKARFDAGEATEEDLEQARHRGTPDEYISCWVDVADKVGVKEQALRAHRSQIPMDWPWLTLSEEGKVAAFGREAFVRVFSRVESAGVEDDLFTGLR